MNYSPLRYTILTLSVCVFNSCLLASEAVAIKEKVEPLIEAARVQDNCSHIVINKEFAKQFLDENIFYTMYDETVDLTKVPYSVRTIPFISNVIAIVWISGKTYSIPSMDERFYHGLLEVRKAFKRMYPQTSWDGHLEPEDRIPSSSYEQMSDHSKAGVLFSGGLDSTSAAYELLAKNLQLTLIMMRGQGSAMLSDDDRWKNQKELGDNFANRHGAQLTWLTSNYHAFLNRPYLASLSPEINDWRVDAIEDLGMWGMTAPILFTRGLPALYMASSRDWEYPYISVGNPLVDHHLSFGNTIKLECTQFDKARAEKVAYVVQQVKNGTSMPLVHVCYHGKFPSCELIECRKCLPTAFAFYAFGANPTEYGFQSTGEKLMEQMKAFLERKQPHMTLWQLMKLQDILRQKESMPAELKWFLDVDLAANVEPSYIKGKKSVTWDDLRDLAPDGLHIPRVKKKILVAEEVE